ncbi:MAG: hypothetical protein HND27_06665 [Bacteroidetes bacterium]|nr:hypothetical protein [Bacteroidota bacterium]MBV6460022.1 hypothetical protein [Flavobacteriales bacterium]NOG95447.1 hypothetical protein [Bacteroidota bacterium]WKZ76640.1 MAG: hypothetical protein QY303_06985 [Vicingaceae bacterium]
MKTINLCVIILITLSLNLAFKSIKAQWLPSGTSIYLDPNNYDKVGIGTSNPQAPLHIIGDGLANAQGWNKAIILDKNAALY